MANDKRANPYDALRAKTGQAEETPVRTDDTPAPNEVVQLSGTMGGVLDRPIPTVNKADVPSGHTSEQTFSPGDWSATDPGQLLCEQCGRPYGFFVQDPFTGRAIHQDCIVVQSGNFRQVVPERDPTLPPP